MKIECCIEEFEHKVKYSSQPYTSEELDHWYPELQKKTISEYRTIINQINERFDEQAMYFCLLNRFFEKPSRTQIYLMENDFSTVNGETVFNYSESSDNKWDFFRINLIPKGSSIPELFFEDKSRFGYMESVILLKRGDIDDESFFNIAVTVLKDGKRALTNNDYILITYLSVGCDGNSISIDYGTQWPPFLPELNNCFA